MIKLQNAILIPFLILSSGAIVPNAIAQVNTAYFTKAPRLLGASTTFSGVEVRGAKYYFNIALPEDAGNNLQQIAIAQRQGAETIDFRLEDTVAYLGTNRDKEGELAIADVTQNEETREITVLLENPIPPGTTFTIGLKPKKNPFFPGVYLFGVRAFPQGNNPVDLYLGAGRLHFYRGGGRISFIGIPHYFH